MPDARHDKNFVRPASAKKGNCVGRLFSSAVDIPIGRQKKFGGIPPMKREFNGERRFGAVVVFAAVAGNHDRGVSFFPEFRSFENPVAFAVSGQNENRVGLHGRPIGYKLRTEAFENGGGENPKSGNDRENSEQEPQRSSPELRGSM